MRACAGLDPEKEVWGMQYNWAILMKCQPGEQKQLSSYVSKLGEIS